MLTESGCIRAGRPITDFLVADSNNNGYEEIIAGTYGGQIYFYEWDGKGFKKIFKGKDLNILSGTLNITDIDNDGISEIIGAHDNILYACNWKNEQLKLHKINLGLEPKINRCRVGKLSGQEGIFILVETEDGILRLFH